jgi:opine dehydrogenase
VNYVETPYGDGLSLSDGVINLTLLKFHTDDAAGDERGKDFHGIHHMGFIVDDLEGYTERVKANGGRFHRELKGGGGVDFERKFRDPQRHRVRPVPQRLGRHQMKIAVIGGGNGAYAAAADFTDRGHEVRMWRRNTSALQKNLTLKDAEGERNVTLALASADIAETLRGAELVFLPDPAFTQADNAGRIAPHLTDGQVVFLAPGTFGAWIMAQAVKAEVAFAETGTLPWLTRKHGPTVAAITARATRLPTGVYPKKSREAAFGVLKKVFPVEPVEDALSAALMNAGPIIHPPLILMNAGPLEHFERWDIHKEGTQPSIRRVTDALDAERIAVREALGYRAPHFPLADHYKADGDEWMYGRRVHKKLTDSKDWHEHIVLTEHRYMKEDIEHGLAFLVSVGEWAGVPCPVARGLLALGSAVVGRDLRKTGRTLENLGLAGLSKAELQNRL